MTERSKALIHLSWSRVTWETYIFLTYIFLNFSLPPRSEQLHGAMQMKSSMTIHL